MDLARFVLATLLNAGGAAAAFRSRGLSADGAIAAFLVGFGIYVLLGATGWTVLMCFFVSSTALSRMGRSSKGSLSSMQVKGSRRDAVQVIANGGPALVAALLFGITGSHVSLLGFGAALAAANADTWSSEIGVTSPRMPVSIVTFRQVTPGSSGGITVRGTVAGLGGALFIGMATTGLLALGRESVGIETTVWITVAGFVGTFVDSVLGATIQARYVSSASGSYTEHAREGGTPNRQAGGLRFVTNDVVNFLSSAAAAGIAAGMAVLVGSA